MVYVWLALERTDILGYTSLYHSTLECSIGNSGYMFVNFWTFWLLGTAHTYIYGLGTKLLVLVLAVSVS